MIQMFLKSSFDLGWAATDYRISIGGGDGQTVFFNSPSHEQAKVVVPLAGTFRNLSIYSLVGTHPNFTVTLMVNDVATALSCVLTDAQSTSSDITSSAAVVAGDDIYLKVTVNPAGSGLGYSLAINIEFEGAQQFYSMNATWGGHNAGQYGTGGALGNGVMGVFGTPIALSGTYSICATAGILTGLAMKTYIGGLATGGSTTGYITKNQVLQDGTGGTVNTACTLVDGTIYASNTFSLPIAVGDHVDFAVLRNTTNIGFGTGATISVMFTPTVSGSFMLCGGSAEAYDGTNPGWVWVRSEQLAIESECQCPISPRGMIATGLYIEVPGPPDSVTPGIQSRIFTITKNGVDTAATVTLSESDETGLITGLSIPFVSGDLITLEHTPVNTPSVPTGIYWGLSAEASTTPTPVTTDVSGIYYINPTKAERHDSYYGSIESKIPNPTVKTALIGE